MASKVCPVCDRSEHSPCEMCAESKAMFLKILIDKTPKPEAMKAEEVQKINIASGEDVCFS